MDDQKNMVFIAVQRLGGPHKAAKKIGVSAGVIYVWQRKGVKGAAAQKVLLLSRLSGVSVRQLFAWPPPVANGRSARAAPKRAAPRRKRKIESPEEQQRAS